MLLLLDKVMYIKGLYNISSYIITVQMSGIQNKLVIISLIFLVILFIRLINEPTITALASLEDVKPDLVSLQNQYPGLFTVMGWEVSKLNSIDETKTLPSDILIETKYTDNYIPEPDDLSKFSYDKTKGYLFQQKIDIITTIIVYKIKYYSGEEQVVSLVTKQINPESQLTNVNIYETIPAHLASKFKTNTKYTLESGAYKYSFASITNQLSLNYAIVDTVVALDDLFEFKTIILPKDDANFDDPVANNVFECGDGYCDVPFETKLVCPNDCLVKRKFPWKYAIVLAAILLISLIYFNAYKGRWDLRRLTRGRSPFRSESEFKTVKTYIKQAIEGGQKKSITKKKLEEKGWKGKQINYAYQEARWELRKVIFDITPKPHKGDLRLLVIYVKKCMLLNADPLLVKKKLNEKGWRPEQIEESFKQARKEL